MPPLGTQRPSVQRVPVVRTLMSLTRASSQLDQSADEKVKRFKIEGVKRTGFDRNVQCDVNDVKRNRVKE
eukprot:1087176-Amphidinium_carterae.1